MINFNIANWLFLLLLAVTLIAVVVTAVAWRQTKQSFHLYNRRAAEIRMQNYMTVTAILMMCMLLVGGYLWIETRDAEAVAGEQLSADEQNTQTESGDAPTLATLSNISATREAEAALLSETPPTPESQEATLPLEYRVVDARANLDTDSEVTRIVFASTLSDSYAPIDPAEQFSTDIQSLYATFDYYSLTNGLEWSWVWRRDGEVIDGGNEVWQYGIEGSAFIFLDPELFEPGEYSAEIWFNESLFARDNATIFQSATNTTVIETNSLRSLTITTPELIQPLTGKIGRLPDQFRELEPQTPISSQTEMELVDFSVQYGGENRPVTLIAAFEHQEMADGMVWSWVWRRDNAIIGGGNRLWREPSDARVGFMHLIPTEALESGEYSVELWVNETLLSRAVIQVTTSLAAQ